MKPRPLSLVCAATLLAFLPGCGTFSSSPKAETTPSAPALPDPPAPAVVVIPVVPVPEAPVPVLVPAPAPAVPAASPTLIAFQGQWKYTLSPEGYEGDWKGADFADSAWSEGKTPIGFGDDEMGTILDNSGTAKIISLRARKTFEVPAPASYSNLRIRIMRDDGIVVYLNGSEIVRDNLPAGALKAASLAPKAISGEAEREYIDLPLPAEKLVAGKNVIALALHQNRATSSDMWFDIELTGEVK